MNRYAEDIRQHALHLYESGISMAAVARELSKELGGRAPREETIRGWILKAKRPMLHEPEAEATGQQRIDVDFAQINRALLTRAIRMLTSGTLTLEKLQKVQAIIDKCEARQARTAGKGGGRAAKGAADNGNGYTSMDRAGSPGGSGGDYGVDDLIAAIDGLDPALRDGVVAGLETWVDLRRSAAVDGRGDLEISV